MLCYQHGMDKYEMYCDGATSIPAVGIMAIGVTIQKNGYEIATVSQKFEVGTNNEAEWLSLVYGLRKCKALEIKEISAFMDSNMVVNQFNRKWKIHAKHLRPLADAAWEAGEGIDVHLSWISREYNDRADELSKDPFRPPVDYERISRILMDKYE